MSPDNEVTSDVVMKTVALLAARPQTRSRFELPELGEEHRSVDLRSFLYFMREITLKNVKSF